MVRRGRLAAVAVVVVGLFVGVPPTAGAAGNETSPPANDRLVRAQRIRLDEQVTGELYGATSGDEDTELCWQTPLASVWYEVEAVVDGVLRVQVDSPADVAVAVFEQVTPTRLRPLQCLDLYAEGERERIGAEVVRGSRYSIAVFTWQPAPGTSFALVAKQHVGPRPANDDFASAAPIGLERVSGTTVGGTRQPGEPEPDCAEDAASTVWYRFEAATRGTRTIHLSSPADQGLDLFEGESLEDLVRIACQDIEWAGDDENLRVMLEPGTYWIAVTPFLHGDQDVFALEVIDNGLAACQWVYAVDVCAETGPLTAPAPKVGVS